MALTYLTTPATPLDTTADLIHANQMWLRRRISAKEGAGLLLRFTVAEPPHRQTVMASLNGLDEIQKAKIRDEIMFLDLAVFANLMGTERVKRHWPKSEDILFEYLAALKESLEMGGGNFDGLLESVEARETAYHDVLMQPLNVARFAVGRTFAGICGFEGDPSVEVAGMGEFVSAVNHVGDLLSHYKIG
jgi:hypothetical protein